MTETPEEAHERFQREANRFADEAQQQMLERLLAMDKRQLIDEVLQLHVALGPFAEIGGWLFARPLPDTDPMVTFEGINDTKWVITRGHFKAASIAYRNLSS